MIYISERVKQSLMAGFFVWLFLISADSRGQEDAARSQNGISDNAYQLMLKKWEEGIDFYALGNEPFWSLDLDFEGVFRFNTLNGLDVKFYAIGSDVSMDASVVRYRKKTDAWEIIIELDHQKCDDTMSDDSYHYKVKVEYKPAGKTEYEVFNGCGNYIPDFRLNDIWAVVELNGEKLFPNDFTKGIPRMEFHIKPESVSGSDGCNNFRGSIEIQHGAILFGMLAGTRMYCPDMEKSEQITGTVSGKKLSYIFDPEGFLLLIDKDKTVMKLKHID